MICWRCWRLNFRSAANRTRQQIFCCTFGPVGLDSRHSRRALGCFFSHRGQLSKLIMMILMQITCGLWRPTAQTYENIVILHRDWLSWVLIYTRPCCKVHRTNIFPAPLHPPHTHPLGRRMGDDGWMFFTARFPTPCVLLIPCLLRLPFVWHFQGIYI